MPLQGNSRAISTLNAYMSPLSAIHDGTVFSDLESETCRVGLAASPPCVQDQKTMFSNAACSNCLSQVCVPQLQKLVSFITEREKKRSIVKRLSNSPWNNRYFLLAAVFDPACPFDDSFFFFLWHTLWFQTHFAPRMCVQNSSAAKNKAVESN